MHTRGLSLILGVLGLCSAAMADNGMPNGSHYNLNVIGVQREKAGDFNDSSGHVIFVKLWGKSTITLYPGNDFTVLDPNGTDGQASFMMPSNVATTYTVWVRTLGTPGGKADMQTCYTDVAGDTYCLGNVVKLERKSGKPAVTNATQDLLYVVVCTTFDASGACTATKTIPIFSDATLGYLWEYDNKGLKLAQLRFYPLN